MKQCRMCSQRLTRPGRLCRECERELDRERAATESVEDLATVIEPPDSHPEGRPRFAVLRTRPAVIVVGFAIGIAIAATGYAVHGVRSVSDAGSSVMIDRDLSRITPREVRAPAAQPRAAASSTIAVSHSARASYDRVLGLADALDRCAHGAAPYARLACEARARALYCGSAGAERIPQCVTPR